ncbi:lysylphosphatidylglycerol synthase transmembrane domain-containing protein [Pseudomonas sp. HR96]|uniref:lysylphosphatidylglycerol synthase transmembrane domain-containing protein n=1 Tax=Pseudomonas sp. HR96 TaxID=1027966 RepID=UPI002A74CE46|nr:lysylphosphatidylglycerol synthase transmembrane domain-containing protein [Pseudomonas sp. HR96]WPO99120.1 lysylphosphatidylglycerol synthase transmembrane domain-containing protein [Pseudomonas sp. HR96]
MSRLLWLSLALLAALAVPWWLGGSELWARLQGFPRPLLLILFGMIGLCWCVNACRMRLLLAGGAGAPSFGKSVAVVMATEFAMCATPGGSGGALTLMALLARNGVPPARSSAVFAMDQLSDLVFFFCALLGILLYAFFHRLDRNIEAMLAISAALLVLAMAACYGLARYHRSLLGLSARLLARLRIHRTRRWRWARRSLRFIDSFSDTLRLPLRRLLAVFSLTCLHWSLRLSVLYLAARGLGADLPWAWSFLVQMVSLSAGQFSLLPGGAGAAELTSAALLAPMIGKSSAAAAILIWRAVTYYFYLIAGGPVFVAMLGRGLLSKREA